VQLWNVTRPGRPVALGPSLTAPDPVDGTVAYGPGGRLAAGSRDGATWLWRATPASAAAYVCAVSGGPITAAEWARYVPGLPYKPPCPGSARE
jgi:hypothetical protein